VPSADVIVVGAGPVGLVTAYGLARVGVSVTVLEAEHEVADSPRAMVYHWALLEDLAGLDLLAEIDRRGFRKDDYGYRVHATGEMLTYTLDSLADETPFPYNIHLGQDALCTIVLERLKSFPHATVRWGAPVTGLDQDGDGVRATATTSDGDGEEQHDAAWLIGADGARSTVRRWLAVPFEGMTWEQRFVATNVFFDFGAHGYTRSVFLMDDVHGAVIAKITDQDLWRVTYSEPLTEPEAQIGDRIDAHYAAILPGGGPYELERYAGYRLHQRAAERLRVGRVLLAGDAAHATNPTGGFGLAGGLCGAFALIDTLASVIAHGAGHDHLDRWADERRRIFLEIASPAATRMKQTVYDADPSTGHETIEAFRRTLADPPALRARLMFPTKLKSVTPTLSER
jgi:2-polyprenyl-6-methoxyphenol hydroxylase-like FAD-dependent oxidoreductase